MRVAELLLFGVAGWSGIGLAGVTVSWCRGERQRVMQGMRWLVVVWVVYVCVLVGVSLGQKQKVLAMGMPQCFGDMCFTVTKVEELPGFLMRDRRRLLRVSVQVSNRGRAAHREELIREYLVDSEGRRWDKSAGISGVGLNARVGGGQTVMGEPVFEIAEDAKGLRLVLTHGWKQRGLLVIGDSDSVLHRRTGVDLGR